MATDEMIVQSARGTSTHVFGRTVVSAREHHVIIDGTQEPAEEITPVEAFLGTVAACAVQHVERYAREDGIPVERVSARMVAQRRRDAPQRFHHVDLRVEAVGPTQQQAEAMVAKFQSHCPLYGTLAASTEVTVQVTTSEGEPPVR